MRTQRKLVKTLIFLLTLGMLAAGSGPGFSTSFSLKQYTAQTQSYRPKLQSIFPQPVLAYVDFDGDSLPDLVELVSNGFQKHIHLSFGSHWTANLHFTTDSPQTGRLHTGDFDRDNDNDLIWISSQYPIQTELWLNNGGGEFTQVKDATPYAAEIERLSLETGTSQSQLAAADGSLQLATVPSSGFWLKRTEHQLFNSTLEEALPVFGWTFQAGLAAHLACHPKRGPPANLA
ncbi:MAG: VCBS repeat-containing protein [Blastocatellia bacterium]|nr:VCBS repeat-containing protein [Blastocatellia bacterium]